MSTNSQRFKAQGAIADGPALKGVDTNLENHYVSIRFYSDSGFRNIVDKATMTGTVTVEMSEIGDEFGTVSDGTITLGTTQYNRPNSSGSISQVRATFNTVTGATHFRMLVSSFAG